MVFLPSPLENIIYYIENILDSTPVAYDRCRPKRSRIKAE